MSDSSFKINKMDFYYDRTIRKDYIEIADKCTDGFLFLWNKSYLDANLCEGNVFFHKFKHGDIRIKVEYLYTMDYLSCVLSAYKQTCNDLYKEKFLELFEMFVEYIKNENIFENVTEIELDLPIMGQILVVIKAVDILGYIPHKDVIVSLFIKYADWLMNDENYSFNNNHGLFLDLALLHLSVFLREHPDSELWQKHALERTKKLFSVAYYDDYTNNEHSLSYFKHNNTLYKVIIDFCKYYNTTGVESINEKYSKICETLNIFAHNDDSFPVIGDGEVFYGEGNDISKLFPNLGVAVLKHDQLYMAFKNKTVFQLHAHTDISSITARYKDIDFIVDSGHFNYNRYTPINRFVRSSAGHSGIFPLFADGMFQKEFCEKISYSEITEYEHNESNSYVKGVYQLLDVEVCREIHISENEIIINDSWKCENPTTMRQRFVISKELIEHSQFTASKRTLESHVGNCSFKFEIIPSSEKALTEVQFGVAAPKYYEYETTMLLDTYIENSTAGEITAKITFREE